LYSKYAIFILFLSAVEKDVFTAGLQRGWDGGWGDAS